MDNAGKLMENPYADKCANLLVVESPAGVGYSYCEAMRSGGSCANTDVSTAGAACGTRRLLCQVFRPALRLFSSPASRTPALLPHPCCGDRGGNAKGGPQINLTGMAVGDPCTDNDSQRQSMDMLWYAHKNGLVPDAEYNFLTQQRGASHLSGHTVGAWVAEANADGEARVVGATPRRPASLRLLAARAQIVLRRCAATSSRRAGRLAKLGARVRQ